MYRKIYALLAFLLAAVMAKGQYTPMQRIDVRINVWQTRQALIYVPEDVKPGQTYPLLVCFHGRSIAGNDPSKIFREGVTRQLKEGKKIEAVNKKDGKKYQFIVLAPLAESWSFAPQDVSRMLDDVIGKYPIDTSRMYLTGYSAGGWSVESAKTQNKELSNRIAGCVTMSAARVEPDHLKRYNLVANAGIHTWYFAGDKDDYFLNNAKEAIDSTNRYKPGLTKLTVYPGAHCCWHMFYNPKYRENGMNIYEWLLQFQSYNATRKNRK
ncbi:hypothetical protein SAMN05660909_02547 [Chitinophaga terrae (ex Kim and Jung 2007)]|jgi:hypothetical protein|uniref:Prolyl oligopeptidase family serine peptidase n=1 Tax=Chitinophaga terrae (ex Kim and Jung 2007) TaxID=408074 RepID=A0A1H4CCN0_9BACT|nr:hypothetical protein [Chitinophaga terrae (ex Kim and Jung 2007)]MDQ0109389.1 hypothetical protein [Chitinophaga terrae (ex Kim and Jung 2007)]SEA58090.1 hypothetical protein SAMN05660909_02547 [Chitinophaga terrae (ex Kim and Jung 2007)]